MQALGIEFISVFGLPPVEFVKLAAELGVQHVTTPLAPIDYNPEGYPRWSLREDRALRRDYVSALRDHGVSLSMGEGFLISPGVQAAEAWAGDLEIMGELGAPRVNVVSLEPDPARNVDQLGALAETAAQFGVKPQLEFVPCFAVADLATARTIVKQVGRPGVGLVIDTMHVGRSGATAADLAALEPELVGYVQLCDAPWSPTIPDYLEEAMYERRGPGGGELPLLDYLKALPPGRVVGLETPMRSLAEAGVGPRERLAQGIAAARELVARAWETANASP
jgi:sugar phosphate isomerase/epimerase